MSGVDTKAWAAFEAIPPPSRRQERSLGLVPDEQPTEAPTAAESAEAPMTAEVGESGEQTPNETPSIAREEEDAASSRLAGSVAAAEAALHGAGAPAREVPTSKAQPAAPQSAPTAPEVSLRSAARRVDEGAPAPTSQPSRTPSFGGGGVAARGADASAARPGSRISAADLATQRTGRREADQVKARLERHRVPVAEARGAVERGTARIEVHLQRRAGALDSLLDAVAEEFTAPDTEVEILSDALVVLWLPVRADEPARKRAFWVPADLRERVRTHLEQTGESVTQLVLRAYNLYHDRVEGDFHADDMPEGPIRIYAGRRRQDLATPVQLAVYVKRHQEAQIDETVARSGAGSRSALLTALVERYLDEVAAEQR